MARPKNQEARRHELRLAASRAMAGQGTGGVRLKDIAQEAGLAPASVLYYYPDVDVLVREAFVEAIERFSDRRHAAVHTIDDPRDQLIEMICSGLPVGPDDVDVLMLYQSVGFVHRDPELAAIVSRLRDEQVRLYRQILVAGRSQGLFDLADRPPALARNLVALEDAYGLYVVGIGLEIDAARAALLSFARIATRCRLALPSGAARREPPRPGRRPVRAG